MVKVLVCGCPVTPPALSTLTYSLRPSNCCLLYTTFLLQNLNLLWQFHMFGHCGTQIHVICQPFFAIFHVREHVNSCSPLPGDSRLVLPWSLVCPHWRPPAGPGPPLVAYLALSSSTLVLEPILHLPQNYQWPMWHLTVRTRVKWSNGKNYDDIANIMRHFNCTYAGGVTFLVCSIFFSP